MGADLVELCVATTRSRWCAPSCHTRRSSCTTPSWLSRSPASTASCPIWGCTPSRTGPCENWSELLPQGRIARVARRPGGGRRDGRARHGQPRRRYVVRRAPTPLTGDTNRRLGRPGVPGRALRATEIVPRPSTRTWALKLGHGGRVRARHARPARVRGQATRRHVGRFSSCGPCRMPAPPCSARSSTSNTGRSCAWNMARALTFVKPCMAEARIPIHMNAGMAWVACRCSSTPWWIAVCRAAKACVDILRLDGL